jgi:hypothetical protein
VSEVRRVPLPGRVAHRPQDHPFFWVILALGVVVLAFFVLAAVIAIRTGPVKKDLGWLPELHWNGTALVTQVNPDGPAAGRLAPEDRVLAVDGDSSGALWNLWLARPGASYTIRILRGGVEYEFILPVRVRRDPKWLWLTVSVVPLGLSCYVVGLLVGLLRPEQRASRLLAMSTVLFAPGVIVQYFPSDVLTGWALVVSLAARGPNDLALAVAYQFYLAFPEGVPRGRGTKVLTVVFYVWGVLSCLWWFLAATPLASHLSHLAYSWRAWDRAWNLLATVNLVAIGAALLQSLRASMSPDHRRRVKWVLFGSAVGVLPRAAVLVFFVVADALGYHNPLMSRAFFLSIQLTNVLLLAIPLTLLYAVVKHRLFDISLVLRRGLQYMLARNLLRVTLLLPLALLIGGVLAHPERTVGEVLFAHPGYLLLMAASGVSLRSRDRLTAWLDRRFFRDAYAKEQLLLALIEDVGSHDSLPRLSELVGHRLKEALHPEGVYLLFRAAAGQEFSPGAAREHPEGLRIAEASSLVQRAHDAVGAVELTSSGGAEMPEALGARVLVPIRTSDGRLVGMLLLGGKRSEEPYSQTDRKLLEALAAQIAIVYENESLRKRVAEGERVQREVLGRLDHEGVSLLKECPQCGLCYEGSADACERDQEPLTFTLPVQRTIDGRYRLERRLGKGGMGAVYEARDMRLDRKVAVKVLGAASFGDRKALRRFESEARALARLRHPNIVAVHDFGQIHPLGAYIVMELLNGTNLRSEIQASGGLPPLIVAEWFDQIFEGVKAAHHSGIVHRDLKPENVFVSRDAQGRALLNIVDFGLAKLRRFEGSDSASLTAVGTVMGTRAYMSPEQLRGREVGERTDIFALGVMIVECLIGESPFREKDAAEMTADEVNGAIRIQGESTALQALNTGLGKCLARDPEARYPTVARAQEALIPLIRDCPRYPVRRGPIPGTETSTV